MRTTILLSSLLFLAGYAPAQDSPITVGDSIPITAGGKRGAPKKVATSTSTYVGHGQFHYDGKIHHVSDPGYEAACFEMVPGVFESLLRKPWKLAINDDGVVLKSTSKPERIEIEYDSKSVDIHEHYHQVVGEQLKSVTLSVTNGTTTKKTTYPASGTTAPSPLIFEIHYCKGGVCPDPKCK